MPQLLTTEEAKALGRRTDAFTGYGLAGTQRTIQWQRKWELPKEPKYTSPTANPNGVSGWCILDGVTKKRVHVCAHDPCTAMHVDRHGAYLVSKFGDKGPPDDHVRVYPPHLAHLVPTPSAVVAATSSVVTETPPPTAPPTPIEVSAPEPSLHPPTDVTALPSASSSTEVSDQLNLLPSSSHKELNAPPSSPPKEAIALPPSSPASEPSSESSSPRSLETEKSSSRTSSPRHVAAPPGGSHDIPEPARAKLEPIVGAPPSSTGPHPPVQHASLLSAVAELAGVAEDDTEDISVVAELSNPGLAAELKEFMSNLLHPQRPLGIAAFILFSLVFQLRVRIWYVDTNQDIVATHAPWAVDYIPEWATVEAVGCKVGEGGSLRMSDPDRNGMDITHWVGAWPCDAAWAFDADAFMDDEDERMQRHYRAHGLQIERTECQDDCGIDTMSLMLGVERSLAKRTEIRRKLVEFVNNHKGNRALIKMLCDTGEL